MTPRDFPLELADFLRAHEIRVAARGELFDELGVPYIRPAAHCRHFDTSAAFECRQEIPVRISKKSKRNECDLFEPKLAQEFERDNERLDPEDARAAFDALFNKLG